jgi:hypothetical protein
MIGLTQAIIPQVNQIYQPFDYVFFFPSPFGWPDPPVCFGFSLKINPLWAHTRMTIMYYSVFIPPLLQACSIPTASSSTTISDWTLSHGTWDLLDLCTTSSSIHLSYLIRLFLSNWADQGEQGYATPETRL